MGKPGPANKPRVEKARTTVYTEAAYVVPKDGRERCVRCGLPGDTGGGRPRLRLTYLVVYSTGLNVLVGKSHATPVMVCQSEHGCHTRVNYRRCEATNSGGYSWPELLTLWDGRPGDMIGCLLEQGHLGDHRNSCAMIWR